MSVTETSPGCQVHNPARTARIRHRSRRVLVVGVLIAPLFCWYVAELPVTEALCTDLPARGDALVFTDNSPGAILLADGMHTAMRQAGYATVVTADEHEFIQALPTKQWSFVTVATRYSDAEPAYADALRDCVAHGGIAQVFRWRDDPNAPAAADSVVFAPTVVQVWLENSTALAYMNCESGAGTAVTVPGLVFGDFAAVVPQSPVCVTPGEHAPLLPESQTSAELLNEYETLRTLARTALERSACAGGVDLPSPHPIIADTTTTQKALDEYHEAVLAAIDQLLRDIIECTGAYGPTPEYPGDAGALAACAEAAGRDYANAVTAAGNRYRAKVERIRRTTSQPT